MPNLIAVLAQPRFWGVWIVLFAGTIGYHRLLPTPVQDKAKKVWDTEVKPLVLNLIDEFDLKSIKDVPEEISKALEPASVDPGNYIQRHIAWGGTTWVIALLVCSLLPKRAGKAVDEDVRVAAEHAPQRTKVDNLMRNYKEFAIRAAQGRCMVTYAILSFAAGVFVRVDSASSPQAMVLHVTALSAVAIAAAAWSTEQPSLSFSDYPGLLMSIKIGFGGVFFAGLIALAISLPYRMSLLPESVVYKILIIRLAALPLMALAGSLVCLICVRRNAGRPLRLRAPVP